MMDSVIWSRDRYKPFVEFCVNFIMLILEVVPYACIWQYLYFPYMQNPFHGRGNLAVIGLYALVLFFFTKGFNGYNLATMRSSDSIVSNLLALFFADIIGLIEVMLVTVHYITIGDFLAMMVIQACVLIIYLMLVRQVFKKLYPPHRVLVVYGQYSPDRMIMKMSTRGDRYNIEDTISIFEGKEKVEDRIRQYHSVLIYDLSAQERNDVLKFCFDNSIRTYLTPKVSDIIISGMDDVYLFDTPLYLARNMGLSPFQKTVKRAEDIIFSLIGLVIASPLMLVIAICIKCHDGGPVLFRQRRLTYGGKPFTIYKFRSMMVKAEEDGAQLMKKNDARVTPVGRVIRNLHLDELPQLINILRGDMSIVGPRPERPEIFKQYEDSVPEFAYRLRVKAGLTGFAQVHGKYNSTPIDKLKYDMIYIQQYSLMMDVKLVLLTVKILFRKDNAEGVDQNQKTALKEDYHES